MAAATLYLSHAAVAELETAQLIIDEHVFTVLGRCTRCRETAPCSALVAASAVFERYHQLPRRRPGLAYRGTR